MRRGGRWRYDRGPQRIQVAAKILVLQPLWERSDPGWVLHPAVSLMLGPLPINVGISARMHYGVHRWDTRAKKEPLTKYCALETERRKQRPRYTSSRTKPQWVTLDAYQKNMSINVALLSLEEPREANQLQGLQRRVGDKLEDERGGAGVVCARLASLHICACVGASQLFSCNMA